MSSRNGNGPKLELKLNLSPPRANRRRESPSRSETVSPTSPPSSCVSSELTQVDSPETTSMVLVGCPRCLMYVMLSEDDPKCPKCKSTVLLDFPENQSHVYSCQWHSSSLKGEGEAPTFDFFGCCCQVPISLSFLALFFSSTIQPTFLHNLINLYILSEFQADSFLHLS